MLNLRIGWAFQAIGSNNKGSSIVSKKVAFWDSSFLRKRKTSKNLGILQLQILVLLTLVIG